MEKTIMPIKKISVSLTDELNDTIVSAVQSGNYKSSSEVVREALRDWQKRRSSEALDEAYMRSAVEEGIASGDAVPASREMFKQLREMATGGVK